LTAEESAVRLTVIEHIPSVFYFNDATVVVTSVGHRTIRRFVVVDPKIRVADDDPAVAETIPSQRQSVGSSTGADQTM
jgi:hypothetical protein